MDLSKVLGVWLLFVAGAALSWGIYVPTVHMAQMTLKSSLRSFLMVGIAYFITAVLIPAFFIFVLNNDPTVKTGQTPNFNPMACVWGILGGTLGAAGALCIIFAVANGGSPLLVAPLVFAGAPIINTLVTITIFHPVKTMPDPRFFLGLAMAAAGAFMVMIFKPVDPKPAPAGGPPSANAPATPGPAAPAH